MNFPWIDLTVNVLNATYGGYVDLLCDLVGYCRMWSCRWGEVCIDLLGWMWLTLPSFASDDKEMMKIAALLTVDGCLVVGGCWLMR